MKGILLDSLEVELDDRLSDMLGGAWNGPIIDGVRHAAEGNGALRFFWGELIELGKPVVLDIGASTGSYCLLACFMEMAKVHAFEPMPLACDILRSNVLLNGLEDVVTVHEVALTDCDGQGELKVPTSRKYAGFSSLGRPIRTQLKASWQSVHVETKCLDSLCLGQVDIVKIDTEGCELMVLRGGEKTIRDWMPPILLEYERTNTAQFGYKPQELTALLESWGYRSFRKVGKEDLWVTE